MVLQPSIVVDWWWLETLSQILAGETQSTVINQNIIWKLYLSKSHKVPSLLPIRSESHMGLPRGFLLCICETILLLK